MPSPLRGERTRKSSIIALMIVETAITIKKEIKERINTNIIFSDFISIIKREIYW